jgi:hypothetical protein
MGECYVRKLYGFVVVMAFVTGARSSEAADERVRRWVSPDQEITLSSTAGHHEDGLTEYELRLIRSGHKPMLIDKYFRSVDVLWNSDSQYVAINDWIGSNIADCFIVNTRKPKTKISVATLVPKLEEDLRNSHTYVSCESWQSPSEVSVRVFGHTDYVPYHEFDYRFALDVSGRQLKEKAP